MTKPTTEMSMTGGCLCGAVRYAIAVEPLFGGRCYCEDCRKASSTGHSAVMAVPAVGFSITGEENSYAKPGGSGQTITRYFCPTCGSGTHSAPESLPGVYFVRASTLDNPEAFKPGMSIYAARAPSWDRPPAGFPTFDEAPPPPES